MLTGEGVSPPERWPLTGNDARGTETQPTPMSPGVTLPTLTCGNRCHCCAILSLHPENAVRVEAW